MWQQNQKPKLGGKKTSRARNKKRPMHFHRVRAHIKLLNVEGNHRFEGRVLLNDLKPHGLMVYLSDYLEINSEIAITLEEPRGLYVKGVVDRIEDFNQSSHIMSENPLSFRIFVSLVFEDEEERAQIESICERVNQEILYPSAQKKAA